MFVAVQIGIVVRSRFVIKLVRRDAHVMERTTRRIPLCGSSDHILNVNEGNGMPEAIGPSSGDISCECTTKEMGILS